MPTPFEVDILLYFPNRLVYYHQFGEIRIFSI